VGHSTDSQIVERLRMRRVELDRRLIKARPRHRLLIHGIFHSAKELFFFFFFFFCFFFFFFLFFSFFFFFFFFFFSFFFTVFFFFFFFFFLSLHRSERLT